MARAPDPQLRRRWRQLIDTFDPERFTVAQFCRQHGVSPPSFYAWRRKLAQDQTLGHDQRQSRDSQPAQAPPAFVSLQLVNDVQHTTAASMVQVHLPGGVRVDVPVGQKDLLWELIESLSPTKEQ